MALGAGLWGTDALFRNSLARQVSAPTLVFAEHLVLVLVLLPYLPRSVRAFGRLDARARGAVIAIGAGASAVATTLFTMAFKISSAQGDFVTPVVVLREKVRTKFAAFAVPGILGVWLLAFPNPLSVSVSRVSVVLLALAAAALWAGGTVLGRLVAVELEPVELTTLRFAVGLPAAAVIVVVSGSDFWVPDLSSSGAVVGLALVPGLLAMVLYYVGLRRTAASRATLAELAFPLTGAVAGILLGSSAPGGLTSTQWLGAAVIAAAVTGLSWHEARARVQAVSAPTPTVAAEPMPFLR